MNFGVIACSHCRQPWSVELRHATATCPNCNKKVEIAHKTLLWTGDSASDAQAATAQVRLAAAGDERAPLFQAAQVRPVPKHDSFADAAASRAVGIINKSQRAETVALWLTRLSGTHCHDELLVALEKSGLERQRAAAEVTRMLAMDYLTEPKAGHYRAIDS